MTVRTIVVDTDGGVATITLNRPSSDNRIDELMAAELRDACVALNQNDDVSVVVVTGQGDAFCRGIEPPSIRTSSEGLRAVKVAEAMAAIENPVVAAINGDAIDQGLELALACDIRIASSEATFGLTQVKSGAMPWDGGTQRLARLVGRGRATEMILTSRIIDAREALAMGLISHIVEPGEVVARARKLASTIVGHGPIAARYLKEAVMKGLDMTLEQGLRLEADLNLLLHGTADRAEGIRSFLERRAPGYRGE